MFNAFGLKGYIVWVYVLYFLKIFVVSVAMPYLISKTRPICGVRSWR